jgi:NADH:ubiquinone oxidoreductase subunit F (NADH-binding)
MISMCAEFRANKSCEICIVCRKCIQAVKITMSTALTEVTTTMSTVYTTLDFEYRHENKGSDLVLVPRKYLVYK